MRNLSFHQAALRIKRGRRDEYNYRPGTFNLTASFRDKRIDWHTINTIGALRAIASLPEIARILDIPYHTVWKCGRIYAHRNFRAMKGKGGVLRMVGG